MDVPRHRRPARALLLCGVLLASCAADRHGRAAEPDPPVRETRTGVPVLMDLPVLGFFFGRRRVER